MPAPGSRDPNVWSEDGSARRCGHCGKWKPATPEHFEANRRKPNGIGSRCRGCLKEYNHTPTRRARRHRHHLRDEYQLTPLEYSDMERAQGHTCALCGEPCSTGRRLAVDHDHETGRVRGLLCNQCNRVLGLAGDDPDRLRRMAAYVEHFRQDSGSSDPNA